MKKTITRMGLSILLVALFYVGVLIADSLTLRNDIVRLHVVANSDEEQDQKNKITVKNTIVSYLQKDAAGLTNAEDARAYLQMQLPQIEELANRTLVELGSTDKAKVVITKEEFGIRAYDTFSLPSGVYDSLRVEIGQGNGKNWWCVVFPALCTPTSADGFTAVAASAGFNESLINTLTQENGYEIRFYLLDCIGKLENIFFS